MIDAKIALVPAAIALVSIVGFWKGPKAAGIAASLPIVAGPILLVLAFQMGPEFAKAAAIAAIASIAASEAYNVIYSRFCVRVAWPAAIAAGVSGWLIVALFVAKLPHTLIMSIAVAGATVWLSSLVQPRGRASPPRPGFRGSTLVARMLLGGVLAAVVSTGAAGLGPVWSGLLSVFPILGIVMTVSVHRNEGADRVREICRGMIFGRMSFMVFCAYVAVRLTDEGVYQTFVEAAAATLTLHCLGQCVFMRPKRLRQPLKSSP